MVAKGLNFPRVTLVGVVAADQGLAAPDFRAAEQTYQLIAQVSGRAGRADQPGRVIVQSYDVAAPAIVCALENRPKTFFDAELAIRERHCYPPYHALMRVLWRSEDPHLVARIAQEQTKRMQEHCHDERLLGPSPAGISFMKGQYRWHCLVKADSRQAIQHFIKRITNSHVLAQIKDVITLIDVDPYEFS